MSDVGGVSMTSPTALLDEALDALEHAVGLVQEVDLDDMSPDAELAAARRLEVLRRRLDHGTDRAAAHLDASAAFSIDGHRNVRCALKHLGRLSGAEAHGRTQTARILPDLPAVEAAYARGEIPTQHVRAIARVVANPRVRDFVPVADPVFAQQASTETYDDFCAWLRQWEALADADGAAQDAARSHERRCFAFVENAMDGSWTSQGHHGALQGAAMKELLDRYEDAEFHADWAEARAIHGHDARAELLRRTPAQRRADALLEIFRRAGAVSADARSPEPLVNIVVDQKTFQEELRRMAGETVDTDPAEVDGRRCQTLGGTHLHPSDAVAAAFVGHVRRVVVDGAGTVIDLGRRRRLFTGSSRDAAVLQGFLRHHGRLRCLWPGCDSCHRDIDHRDPSARGGPTDIANSDPYCASHNRIKERGFRPVRGPDGSWTIHRPGDGGPITSPV